MPAILAISNFTFVDTTWEPGETIEISFDLQNSGTTDLASMDYLTLSIRDTGGELVGNYGSFQFPTVPAGQTITVTQSIDVRGLQLAAGTYTAGFRISTYDSDNIDEFSAEMPFTTTGLPFFTQFNDAFVSTSSGTIDALAGDDDINFINTNAQFDEVIYGNDGNDTIRYQGGDDVVYGGNGDDLIADVYRGGQWELTLPGYWQGERQNGANEIHGDSGDDNIFTANLEDTIYGDDGNDIIQLNQAGTSQDGVVLTQADVDAMASTTIYGGDGDDLIQSRAENPDYIKGAVIYGGAGDDTIRSNNAADVIDGGAGADNIELNLAPGAIPVYAYPAVAGNFRQSATLGDGGWASGGGGADTINGSTLDDYLRGGKGADTIKGGNGADLISGDKGADKVSGQRGNDDISGGKGDDKISGNVGEDKLSGNKGADKLYGGASADEIYGNKGDDVIKGGSGDDLILGGKGDDKLVGGLGIDNFVFAAGDGDDIIKDFEDGVDLIQINATLASTGALIVEEQGAHTLVTFEDVSILIKNVDYTQITLEDFVF